MTKVYHAIANPHVVQLSLFSLQEPIPPEKRVCKRCQQPKLKSEFSPEKECRDGIRTTCRNCIAELARLRRAANSPSPVRIYNRGHSAVRHDYFSVLDTPVKAYVLGLLASDGNVSSKDNRIAWCLSSKDECLAEFLRDELAPNHLLHHFVNVNSFSPRPRVTLRFSSKQMVNDLARYGIGPRKSFTLRWPNELPDSLAHAFLLGAFDGDGCMTTGRHQTRWYPRWYLVSASKAFLEDVASIVNRLIGLKMTPPYLKPNSNQTTYALRISGRGAHILDEWMHQDGLGLVRKRIASLPVKVR